MKKEELTSKLDEWRLQGDWRKVYDALRKHSKLLPDSTTNGVVYRVQAEFFMQLATSKEKEYDIMQLEEFYADLCTLRKPLSFRAFKHPSMGASLTIPADLLSRECSILDVEKCPALFTQALMEYYRGEYVDKCWRTLAMIKCLVEDVRSLLKDPSLLMPYSRIMILQIMSLKFRMADVMKQSAVDSEMEATVFLDLLSCKEFMSPFLQKTHWLPLVEDALYVLAFKYLDGSTKLTTRVCRTYLQLTGMFPVSRQLQRISLTRNFVHSLLVTCRDIDYVPPTLILMDDSEVCAPTNVIEELEMALELYENLVLTAIPFPKAGHESWIQDNLYDDLTLAYVMLSPLRPSIEVMRSQETNAQSKENIMPSTKSTKSGMTKVSIEDPEQIYTMSSRELLVEAYYRALNNTFRSRSILRRLAITAYYLDSIDEAWLFIKAYLEKDKKDALGEWWSRSSTLASAPPLSAQSTHQLPLAVADSMNGETNGDVIAMFLLGCQVSLQMALPHDAVTFAEAAMEQCRLYPLAHGQLYMPLAYYSMGRSFSRLSIESLEHEQHKMLQDQSEVLLQASRKIDRHSVRLMYGLARHMAESGNIEEAKELMKKCISYSPASIDCWHILAVLTLSAKASSDSTFHRVIRTFQIFHTATIAILSPGYRKQDSKTNRVLPPAQMEHWISFKMTEALLQEIAMNLVFDRNDIIDTESLEHPPPTESEIATALERLPKDATEPYRALFKHYVSTYYVPGKRIREESTAEKYRVDDADDQSSSMFPIQDIISSLNSIPHPPVPSLHSLGLPHHDIHGPYSIPVTEAIRQGLTGPLRHVEYIRRQRATWCDLWLQFAAMYRRCDDLNSATEACKKVSDVLDCADADVQYELGMIELCRIRMTTEVLNEDLPKVKSEFQRDTTFDKAMSHFESAILCDEEHAAARTMIGWIYLSQKNLEMAIGALDRATRTGRAGFGGSNWQTWTLLADVSYEQGRFSNAAECLKSMSKRQLAQVGVGACVESADTEIPRFFRGLEAVSRTFWE